MTDLSLPLDGAPTAEKKPRKKKSGSPTQRSLAEMRKRGYTCAVTERWNPFAHIRQDLFGIVDVLCVGNGETVAVQCCSGDGGAVAERTRKIADAEATPELRKSGWKIVVHGWRKNAAGFWVLREVDCS